MKPTLYLQPRTGFCSRMLVLNEAYLMAKECNARLVIIWKQTADCNCEYYMAFDKSQFSDIDCQVWQTFEMSDFKGYLKKGQMSSVFHCLGQVVPWIKSVTLRRKYEKLKGQFYPYEERDRSVQAGYAKQMEATLKEGKDVYCMAYEGLTGYEGENFYNLEAIKIGQGVIEEAKAITGEQEYVSVHIRRTDHVVAIANSKTDDFVEKMQEELDRNPDTRFFLATDDMTEEERIISIFGDRIIVQKNKDLRRSSLEGMHCSLIDLMCLAGGKYVIGSQRSIFSKVSAQLNNIPLYIANEAKN